MALETWKRSESEGDKGSLWRIRKWVIWLHFNHTAVKEKKAKPFIGTHQPLSAPSPSPSPLHLHDPHSSLFFSTHPSGFSFQLFRNIFYIISTIAQTERLQNFIHSSGRQFLNFLLSLSFFFSQNLAMEARLY